MFVVGVKECGHVLFHTSHVPSPHAFCTSLIWNLFPSRENFYSQHLRQIKYNTMHTFSPEIQTYACSDIPERYLEPISKSRKFLFTTSVARVGPDCVKLALNGCSFLQSTARLSLQRDRTYNPHLCGYETRAVLSHGTTVR